VARDSIVEESQEDSSEGSLFVPAKTEMIKMAKAFTIRFRNRVVLAALACLYLTTSSFAGPLVPSDVNRSFESGEGSPAG